MCHELHSRQEAREPETERDSEIPNPDLEMQQPRMPNPISPSPSPISPMQKPSEEEKKKPPLPTPKELISHYESQGMDSQEASFKVIDDLQNMLVRVISSSSSSKSTRAKKNKFMSEASRKLDTANARLAIVEMKLDSKPGFPQSIALGVTSAAAFRGLASVWPHVSTAALHIWNSVRGATKPSV